MFFGNVTEYHGGSSDFANDGKFGPKARLMVTERVPQTEAWYRQLVSCPHQGFRVSSFRAEAAFDLRDAPHTKTRRTDRIGY